MLGRVLGGGRGGRKCPRGIKECRQLLLAPAVAQAAPCQCRPMWGHCRLGTVVAPLGLSPQSQWVLLRPCCHRGHVSSAPEQHPVPSPPQRGFGGSGDTPANRGDPVPLPPAPAPRINPKPHPPACPLPAPLLPQRCPRSPGWVPGAGGVAPIGVPTGGGKHQGPPGAVCEREGSCGTQPTCQHAQGPRVAPHVRVPGSGAAGRASDFLTGRRGGSSPFNVPRLATTSEGGTRAQRKEMEK